MAEPYRLDQEDLGRRKRLNEELNPRKTIMNEATQTINPLTGKAYVATGEKYGDAEFPRWFRFCFA